MNEILHFISTTGFASMTLGHALMICIGGIFIYLGIAKQFEPSFSRYSVISHYRQKPLSPIAIKFVEFLRENLVENIITELIKDSYESFENHKYY